MIHLTATTENHEAQLCLEQLAALLSWGVVTTDGTTSSAGSGDWLAVKNSTGNYTVLFSLPRGAVPAVVVSPATALSFSVVSGLSSFTAIFGAPTNTAFSFVAMGA